jgi:hypothetical protein
MVSWGEDNGIDGTDIRMFNFNRPMCIAVSQTEFVQGNTQGWAVE